MKDLKRVASELKSLANKSREITSKLDTFIGNVTFEYSQQELIRRVFKSVLPQLKSRRDREIAKHILERTDWIE